MARFWTDHDKQQIAAMLLAGDTYDVIAAEFGVSRNAVAGVITRTKRLHGLSQRALSDEHRERLSAAQRERYSSNVIVFPGARREPLPTVEKPALRVITNTAKAIDDWLKANGGARKFEPGFSTDYLAMKSFLEKRGVTFNLHRGSCFLSNGRGRPRKVTWDEVYRVADKFRVAEGLTPILPESAA